MTREDVFNPANGDRPKIRNIAVVVTDGGSNDFPATVDIIPACGSDSNLWISIIRSNLKWIKVKPVHKLYSPVNRIELDIVWLIQPLNRIKIENIV